VAVPPYCLSRAGKVFRVQRFSELVAPDRVRYVLRAVPIRHVSQGDGLEVSRELDAAVMREMLALRQRIPTPEETFEQLWQQLRLELDVQYG